jgi:hypothetical protein
MRNTVEKNRESDFVVPPHCNNAKELGNRGGEENGAGNLGVLFPCIRQRFQAFSLVSERRSDGFEIVRSHSDRNDADHYKSVSGNTAKSRSKKLEAFERTNFDDEQKPHEDEVDQCELGTLTLD